METTGCWLGTGADGSYVAAAGDQDPTVTEQSCAEDFPADEHVAEIVECFGSGIIELGVGEVPVSACDQYGAVGTEE